MHPRRLLPLLAALAMAGCVSPDPKLYTLAPVPPATQPPPGPPTTIELRHAAIPGYADRPEIVRGAAGYRVELTGNERWSEPLAGMIDAVLAQDLELRLPGAVVYGGDSPISAKPDKVIEVDILGFAADGSGNALLSAQYAVSGVAHAAQFTVPIAGVGTSAYVAALSAALAELAGAIAK